ncbi:hypothetical protein EJ07DRAFT_158801 [Lizonia empirigonia]|nr:hypothetical protein EJ07DRAFT_158801 [Lizonia empirigonia]
MLPTLQQKLRIWTLRRSRASSALNQEAQGIDHPEGGPDKTRRPSETATDPGLEFPDQMSATSDASLPSQHPLTTVKDDRVEADESEAWGRDREITEGLDRDTDHGISSPTSLAIEATRDESTYALDIPSLLSDYIREVQERDKAYLDLESRTRRDEGGAKKGTASWEIDPSGILRRSGKV